MTLVELGGFGRGNLCPEGTLSSVRPSPFSQTVHSPPVSIPAQALLVQKGGAQNVSLYHLGGGGKENVDEVLGAKLPSPFHQPLASVYETILGSAKTVPTKVTEMLDDHQIDGLLVVPAAYFMAAAVQAAAQSSVKKAASEAWEVLHFAVPQGLVLTEDGVGSVARVQIGILRGGDAETMKAEIYSSIAGNGWDLNATGDIRAMEQLMPGVRVDKGSLLKACPQSLSKEAIYAQFDSRLYHYGATLQCIESLWKSRSQAVTEMTIPSPQETADFAVLPNLLDCCIQLILAVQIS